MRQQVQWHLLEARQMELEMADLHVSTLKYKQAEQERRSEEHASLADLAALEDPSAPESLPLLQRLPHMRACRSADLAALNSLQLLKSLALKSLPLWLIWPLLKTLTLLREKEPAAH
ncbi:Adenylate cyclase type 1 [Camelus dromedarius]|uniref:Adenylate cyclase type 1 n=1 Tax=Camelus dromedarius TaxID=9838 RepID=A0A5N4ECN1_CAMDR|nr:Adenylate cyclase type 1 [Camelus dromedarius]